MTIKWVQTDPLVMNGEPFCYGSRLTVRQLLELRRAVVPVVERGLQRRRYVVGLERAREVARGHQQGAVTGAVFQGGELH